MVRKIILLLLVGLPINSALAQLPDEKVEHEANLIDFCKELQGMINAKITGDAQVDRLIKYAFSLSPTYAKFGKYNAYKAKIHSFIKKAGEDTEDNLNQCNDDFENDFTNFAQRVINKKKSFEDESNLTEKQQNDARSMIPDNDGNEKIDVPIGVNGLCPTKELNDCESDLPVGLKPIEDVASFGATVSDQAFSVSDCECYLAKSTSNKKEIISQASNEMNEIDHAILGAAGENFLNQYAAFYEDIGFYGANRPWALKKKGADKETPINETVLCVDPQIFKAAIDESCEKNGTNNGKDERLAEVLGAFGNNFSGGSQNFSDNFDLLKYDIERVSVLKPKWRLPPGVKPVQFNSPGYSSNPISAGSNTGINADKFKLPSNIDFKKTEVPSYLNIDPMSAFSLDMTESFKRADFEKTRFSNALGLPEVSVVDEIIGVIVRDKDLKATLETSIKNNGLPITPLAAIESMLTDNVVNSKNISKIIKKLGQNNKNQTTIKLLQKSLEDKSFDKQRARIFKTALAMHPGLKNIVLDEQLFNQAVGNVSHNNKGIVRLAEKNKDMLEHFSNRCKGLQEKLAEAICTKPSDLKEKVNTQDLVAILKGRGMLPLKDQKLQEAVNLTLCSMNDNKVTKTSIFNGLNSKDTLLTSDFKERKLNTDPSNPKNMFSLFALKSAKDPEFKKEQEKVVQSAAYASTSSDQFGTSSGLGSLRNSSPSFSSSIPDTNAAKDLAGIKHTSMPIDSKVIKNVPEESSAGQTQFESISSTVNNVSAVNNIAQPATQFSNPTVTSTPKIAEIKDSPNQDDQVSAIREELKKSIKSGDQKKIDGLVNNISDADAQELNRYRAESKKDKEEIAALKLEQERVKTQELKAQYDELEKQLAQLKKEKSSVVSNISAGSSSISGQKETNSVQDELGPDFGGKTNSTSFHATGGSTSGNSSATAGNAQAQGQFRDPSSSSNAASGRDLGGKVGDGMSLVIKSQSGNGQAAGEDPSIELITYLTKNETDSKTLRDLKESGLIYTYEVKENGTTVQKKRIIKYNELSAEAKELVNKKISILVEKESSDLERQITSLKRTYSIQALKLEILTSNQSKL